MRHLKYVPCFSFSVIKISFCLSFRLAFRPLEQNLRESASNQQHPPQSVTQTSSLESQPQGVVSSSSLTLRTPTPHGTQVVPRTPTIPQPTTRTATYSQQVVKAERPQSLPGLIVVSSQDGSKSVNQLMSPPPCPPPRTPNTPQSCPRVSPLEVSSPVFVAPSMTSTMAKTSALGKGVAPSLQPQQQSDFSQKQQTVNFSVQQQQSQFQQQQQHPGVTTSPHAVSSKNPQMQTASTAMNHRQTHVSRTSASYRRSDSCPYPIVSPRTPKQQNIQTVTGSSSQCTMSPCAGEMQR